ncbi:MAG: hypothetical protein ACREMF_04235 [Gemmatimonadales bacterium]
MKHLVVACAALGVLACVDSGTAPTADLVSAGEKTAVQQALSLSLGYDSLFLVFSEAVLPFIDQATPRANPSGDTTKLAGFQLEVVAGSLTAGISGILAWRGYRPLTRTVDSVFFVIGAGVVLPLTDSLSDLFAVTLLGSGTAWVIAEAPDSSVQTWRARTGALNVSSASYGAGTSADLGGGFTLTRARGTMAGDYHLTAKLVPDSSTTVTTDQDFSAGGIQGLQLRLTGSGPSTPVRRPARAPFPAPTR